MLNIKLFSLLLSTSLLLGFSGCSSMRTGGGKSTHASATGSTTVLNQSQDPKDSSSSDTDSTVSEELIIPPSSSITITQPQKVGTNRFVGPSSLVVVIPTNATSPAIFKRTIEDKSKTRIGAAQKNVAQEIAASIASMRPVMIAGILVMLLGFGTLHPYLKTLLQFSTTQSLIVIGGGLALIFLPQLFAQHGTLIVVLISCGIAGYIFVYRYSQASTKAKVFKDFIDLNKDGIDDRMQNLEPKNGSNPPPKV